MNNYNQMNYYHQTPNKGIVNNNPKELYDPYMGFICGNLFPELYNSYKINQPYEIKPMNEQAEALTNIDVLEFAMIDLNLYLDNYPNDTKVLETYKHYSNQYKNMCENYELKYGPLSASSTNGNYWNWIDTPWPWENK